MADWLAGWLAGCLWRHCFFLQKCDLTTQNTFWSEGLLSKMQLGSLKTKYCFATCPSKWKGDNSTTKLFCKTSFKCVCTKLKTNIFSETFFLRTLPHLTHRSHWWRNPNDCRAKCLHAVPLHIHPARQSVRHPWCRQKILCLPRFLQRNEINPYAYHATCKQTTKNVHKCQFCIDNVFRTIVSIRLEFPKAVRSATF